MAHQFVKKSSKPGRPKASALCKECGREASKHRKGVSKKSKKRRNPKSSRSGVRKKRPTHEQRFNAFRAGLNQYDGARPWNLSPVGLSAAGFATPYVQNPPGHDLIANTFGPKVARVIKAIKGRGQRAYAMELLNTLRGQRHSFPTGADHGISEKSAGAVRKAIMDVAPPGMVARAYGGYGTNPPRTKFIYCPECGEQCRKRPPDGFIPSWIEPARMQACHLDGTQLCPIVTDRGYQPALPVGVRQSKRKPRRSNPSHYPSMAALRACQAVSRSNAKTKKAVIRVIKRSKSKKRK